MVRVKGRVRVRVRVTVMVRVSGKMSLDLDLRLVSGVVKRSHRNVVSAEKPLEASQI